MAKSRRVSPAIGFLAPFCLFFLLFFIVPIGYALYQSLFRVQRSGLYGEHGTHLIFAGLTNYLRVFQEGAFTDSVLRVLGYAVVQVPVMIVLATVLALLLDAASARWVRFFRSAFFLPYGVPGVIASILWGFLYTPGISPIVSVLGTVGLHVDFLSAGSVLWSIANIVTWQFAGYNMLIIVAQLKSVPGDLLEAARIDGAGSWQTVWHVKLPMIRPAIVLTTVFTIIGSLQLFSEPLVLKPLTGNISSTYTPNMAAYNDAFFHNNYNYAAAEAVLLALIACILSFGFLRLVGRSSRKPRRRPATTEEARG